MKNIVVVYGGKSVEHDISIITGLQALENIDYEKYKVYPVYVSREGEFVFPHKSTKQKDYAKKLKRTKKVSFMLGSPYIKISKVFTRKIKVDCVINCMHGVNGEDGTVSGLCRLCGIPITCPNTLSSAISMDKIIMKDIFKANNIPCVKHTFFIKSDYYDNTQQILEDCESLGFPLIVKPANLGSSIGISVANNSEELQDAIEVAFSFDTRVIVEKCLTDFREINCSVVGSSEQAEASMLEEPKSWKEFLSFDEKYLSSKNADTKRFDVELDEQTVEHIKKLATKVFKCFCCSGVIRIDFMLDNKTGEVFVNELNTIPGSLAFYLWKHKFSYMALVDKLIEIAIFENRKLMLNNYSYKSDVLLKNSGESMNKYTK